mmetsp:Transcript_19557/g.48164  ORF Transcript_19557/g.48164 Transcript_19557/m.48164 type:complete len:182 (+) Transcript_19557:83-628(+)
MAEYAVKKVEEYAVTTATSTICLLAQEAYQETSSIKDTKNIVHAIRLAERLQWILRRKDKWAHICLPQYKVDTYRRLEAALTNVKTVLQKASNKKKSSSSWKDKIKAFVGGTKSMDEMLADADRQLTIVLQEIQIDQKSSILNGISNDVQEMRCMKQSMQGILDHHQNFHNNNNNNNTLVT